MVLLLLKVFESTKVGIVQVTIAKVRCFLTNSKLDTACSLIADSVTSFLCINFISQALNPVGIIRVTHCVLMKKLDINIIICAFFCCRDRVAMSKNIIILIESISVGAFTYCLIREHITSSCVHQSTIYRIISFCTSFIKSNSFKKFAVEHSCVLIWNKLKLIALWVLLTFM